MISFKSLLGHLPLLEEVREYDVVLVRDIHVQYLVPEKVSATVWLLLSCRYNTFLKIFQIKGYIYYNGHILVRAFIPLL